MTGPTALSVTGRASGVVGLKALGVKVNRFRCGFVPSKKTCMLAALDAELSTVVCHDTKSIGIPVEMTSVPDSWCAEPGGSREGCLFRRYPKAHFTGPVNQVKEVNIPTIAE